MALLIAGLVLLVALSLGLNAYFYVSFAPELRDKRFFDSNRDDIDILVLRDGSTFEGIILDETNEDVVVKMRYGTTVFNKQVQIRKIIYDAYRHGIKKEKSLKEGATP